MRSEWFLANPNSYYQRNKGDNVPSKTAKQHRFMAMCSSAKGRAKARGKCPSRKVAHEFMEADKRKRRSGNYLT